MFQEYPKWVNVPGHEDGGVVVFSKEEEESYGLQEVKKPEASEEVKRKPGRPKKVAE